MSKDIYHHGLGLINKSITSEVLRSLRHYLWKELTDTILEVGSFFWCNEPHRIHHPKTWAGLEDSCLPEAVLNPQIHNGKSKVCANCLTMQPPDNLISGHTDWSSKKVCSRPKFPEGINWPASMTHESWKADRRPTNHPARTDQIPHQRAHVWKGWSIKLITSLGQTRYWPDLRSHIYLKTLTLKSSCYNRSDTDQIKDHIIMHGSQGPGLEPDKDLIRTCKDQY